MNTREVADHKRSALSCMYYKVLIKASNHSCIHSDLHGVRAGRNDENDLRGLYTKT